MTEGRAGGGRVKDVEILFGSDEDGQDQEQAHQREGQVEMIWTCTRQEAKRKTKNQIYKYGERGYADGWNTTICEAIPIER